MRLVFAGSASANLEMAMAVFSLPDWEAANACSGLARDFFVIRHIERALHRARGAGNDLIGWDCSVQGDALELRMRVPKRLRVEQTLRVTKPSFVEGALIDFRLEGRPLADLVNPLGFSVDGRAVGWATKMPGETAQLLLLFIDSALAGALPREMQRRPVLMQMPSDSGVVVTDDGTRFTMTDVSSTRRIGGTGFAGQMYPKLPRPAIGPDDPGEPRSTGPDPSAVIAVEVSRGDPSVTWLRFETARSLDERSGVVQLERLGAEDPND